MLHCMNNLVYVYIYCVHVHVYTLGTVCLFSCSLMFPENTEDDCPPHQSTPPPLPLLPLSSPAHPSPLTLHTAQISPWRKLYCLVAPREERGRGRERERVRHSRRESKDRKERVQQRVESSRRPREQNRET